MKMLLKRLTLWTIPRIRWFLRLLCHDLNSGWAYYLPRHDSETCSRSPREASEASIMAQSSISRTLHNHRQLVINELRNHAVKLLIDNISASPLTAWYTLSTSSRYPSHQASGRTRSQDSGAMEGPYGPQIFGRVSEGNPEATRGSCWNGSLLAANYSGMAASQTRPPASPG